MKTPITKMIGRSIRQGQKPGFMTAQIRSPRPSGYSKGESGTIKEAASRALEKRGFSRNPDPWRDGVFCIGARDKKL